MPTPSKQKTVQARVLEYAEAESALLGQFRHLHSDIYRKPDYAEQTGSYSGACRAERLIHVCPYIPKLVFLRADMRRKPCALRTVCDSRDRQLYK